MKKNINSSLNLGNVNPAFISGLNKVLKSIYTLAYAENKRVKTEADYLTDLGLVKGSLTEADKVAMRKDPTVKQAREEVKDNKNRAYNIANMLLIKYTDIDFDNDTADLLTASALESILRNSGMLVGTIAECKEKQVTEAVKIYTDIRSNVGLVLNKKISARADRKRGEYTLTYKEAKTRKNDPLEYILALCDALVKTPAFEYIEEDNAPVQIVNVYAK